MNKHATRIALGAVVSSALGVAASAQTTTRVSVSSSGAQGNGGTGNACAVSQSGRYVTFTSNASILLFPANFHLGWAQVFVRDTLLGVTEVISVNDGGMHGDGNCYEVSISADGRFVAYSSTAPDLVPGDANGWFDVFVRDRVAGTTRRVSVSTGGVEGNGESRHSKISADGRHVVFTSWASNLVAGDTNTDRDVFRHDLQTGVTSRESLGPNSIQAQGASEFPSVSADGRFVAFHSSAANLVSGDTNGAWDVFVRDSQSGSVMRASLTTSGVQYPRHSLLPSLSADGNVVAFHTTAPLVPEDTNDWEDVYIRDIPSGQTKRVSVSSDGGQGNNSSNNGSISPDGRFVVFQGHASNLVPSDTNGVADLFLHDRVTGLTSRVSLTWSGEQCAGHSYAATTPAVTSDGGFVAFASAAEDLVPGDTNSQMDVFLRYVPPILPPIPFSADSEPAATAIANFDLDSFKRPDLAVVNAGSNSVSILPNNGVPGQPPSFAPPAPERTYPVGAGPTAIVAGDVNSDPFFDLAVANTAGGSVSILLSDGAGGLVNAPLILTPGSPRGLTFADLDRDTLPDLLVTRHDDNLISVFRNLGGGNFGPDQPQQPPGPGPSGPSGVGSGDLDNDKDIDVVACVDLAGAILVFPNTSPGPGVISFGPAQVFPVSGASPRPVSVALKDFDFDNYLDVAVAIKNADSVAVFRNLGVDGGGAWLGFAPPVSFGVGSIPVSIGADNIYGFGFADLFTANAFVDANSQSSVSLLRNVTTGPGDIAFEPEIRIEVPALAAHVVSKDVNQDNRVDIAVATGFDAGSLSDSPGAGGGRGSPVGVAAVLAGASPSVVLAPCDGDANGDRVVDFYDLNIVLSFYGQSGPALPGDLNTDAVVDFLDLNIVLSGFGGAC